MKKLVLMRHGESQWNLENRFTGWVDVDLTEKGITEAKQAGEMLKTNGYDFDLAYTSLLTRAIRTLWLTQEMLDRRWIPVIKHWRLNERHYGALQGLNKADTAAQFGEAQVLIWRRSYDTPPPPSTDKNTRDLRYENLLDEEYPQTECLKDTVARVIPYWQIEIAPQVRAGKRVIVVAHGNTIRALIKHFDNLADADIVNLNIPTGTPLVYEFSDDMRPIRRYYLGDEAAIAAAANAVSMQAASPKIAAASPLTGEHRSK